MDQKHHLSGTQARKRANERKEKNDALLSKIPTLHNFFKKPSDNVNTKECFNNNTTSSQYTKCTLPVSNNCDNNKLLNDNVTDNKNDSPITTELNDKSKLCDELISLSCPSTSNNINIYNLNDPATWTNDDDCIDYVCTYGFDQNLNADFSLSKRSYSDFDRNCNKSLFKINRKNGENIVRKWLIYSPSKYVLFCGPCKLFGSKTQLGDTGFSDWKNGHSSMLKHENSVLHKNNLMSFVMRQSNTGRIDTQLAEQITNEMNYWKAVLKRIVEVIKFIGVRGLSFRGDSEQFGKFNNGNFLGILELLAKFDPFNAQHIEKYGNAGRGTTSYLSSTIYEELLLLMENDIIKNIKKELEEAKYYSLIIDSTPDVSNIDQLVIAIRYVLPNGVPVERFLAFIPNSGHKSEEMTNTIVNFLNSHNIPIKNCRGQSYDNARNMSGHYSGLQSRIKDLNKFAEYIPCSAHPLNLVGTCAAESCKNAVSFFMLLQEVYNFFSCSTHRWEILNNYLNKHNILVNNLSATRWSARADACHALFD